MKKSTLSFVRTTAVLIITTLYGANLMAAPTDPITYSDENVIVEESALSGKEAKKVTECITADYKNWEKVSIAGKLKTDMVPIPVTMRVDMEKGKRLSVSLRAPFIGEAFRIEMTPGNIFVINKRAKTYYQLEYDAERPLLDVAQSTMLGRIVLPEDGELSKSNFNKCLFYALGLDAGIAEQPTGYAVVPPTFAENFSYGYTVNNDYNITGVVLAISQKLANAALGANAATDANASAENDADEFVDVADVNIEYTKSGKAKASVHVAPGKYEFTFILEFGEPEYGAKLLEPVELTDKYKSVGLKEVLRF